MENDIQKPAVDAHGSLRPKTFENFVGQASAVVETKVAICSAIKRNDAVPHVLMSGPPGLGKTTLAEIIASTRGSDFIQAMASAIRDESTLTSLLCRLGKSGYENGVMVSPDAVRPTVLFIDEIHQLKPSITELLHSVLEDLRITLKRKDPVTGGLKAMLYSVPKFTMIGATNYLGHMPKPFVDRFPLNLTFETYSNDEISRIIRHSALILGMDMEPDAVDDVARRSRGVPRIANNFLMKVRDMAVVRDVAGDKIGKDIVDETFSIQKIDGIGLTRLDRKVLAYLAQAGRPVGLVSVAQGVDEDLETIQNSSEPMLLRIGFMLRTPQGRQITQAGLDHMGMNAGVFELDPVKKGG
jgi:Holliday junction DNA helicase RuvB